MKRRAMNDMQQNFISTIRQVEHDIRLDDFYGNRHYDSLKLMYIRCKLDNILHDTFKNFETSLQDKLLGRLS